MNALGLVVDQQFYGNGHLGCALVNHSVFNPDGAIRSGAGGRS